jgi:flagellar biosynthesis/type III secretory pathway protein FliH
MPEGAPLSAYLHTVIRANGPGVKEALAMSEVSLDEVFEEFGLTAKWEAKGWEKGLKEGLEKGLEKGLKKNRKALEAVKRERDRALEAKDRAIEGLRRKLQEAGIDSQ